MTELLEIVKGMAYRDAPKRGTSFATTDVVPYIPAEGKADPVPNFCQLARAHWSSLAIPTSIMSSTDFIAEIQRGEILMRSLHGFVEGARYHEPELPTHEHGSLMDFDPPRTMLIKAAILQKINATVFRHEL